MSGSERHPVDPGRGAGERNGPAERSAPGSAVASKGPAGSAGAGLPPARKQVTFDLLRLARAPLAASAARGSLVGFALLWGNAPIDLRRGVALSLLLGASACLYWAGMVLNDLFDLERDRRLHPQRPLPSGAVDAGVAAFLGAALCVVGIAAAALAGLWASGSGAGGLGGTALAACVLLYDALFKRWPRPGAAAMAGCRALNTLLPAFVCAEAPPRALLLYAAATFVYVYGLTLLSTGEDADLPSGSLVEGVGACLLPPLCLALVGTAPERAAPAAVAAVLLAGSVLAGAVNAVGRGTRRVGPALTRRLLRGLSLLDAGFLLAFAPWAWLAPTLALTLAARLLAPWVLAPPPRQAPPEVAH